MSLTEFIAARPDLAPAVLDALFHQAMRDPRTSVSLELSCALVENPSLDLPRVTALLRSQPRASAHWALGFALGRDDVTSGDVIELLGTSFSADSAVRALNWAHARGDTSVQARAVFDHLVAFSAERDLGSLSESLQTRTVPVTVRAELAARCSASGQRNLPTWAVAELVQEALDRAPADQVARIAQDLSTLSGGVLGEHVTRAQATIAERGGPPTPGELAWFRAPTTTSSDVLDYLRQPGKQGAWLDAVQHFADRDGQVARGALRTPAKAYLDRDQCRHSPDPAVRAWANSTLDGTDMTGTGDPDALVARLLDAIRHDGRDPVFHVVDRADVRAEHLESLHAAMVRANLVMSGSWPVFVATHPHASASLRARALVLLGGSPDAQTISAGGAGELAGHLPAVVAARRALDLPARVADLVAGPFIACLSRVPDGVEHLATMQTLLDGDFPGTVGELIATVEELHARR